ncbi:thioredoxin family protein [Weeksellaceae bacterium KMM 9724]|uniref:thioredoxin family protein n=1 Tax=Profundicola chukchiensis TaxID=2961959 RepID=UPI00243B8F00|nr:thioredoxin family protein [Profundicola chukchiensis]MDG4949721.1 thioredoxin family protein [Profundicola chukchiensis]
MQSNTVDLKSYAEKGISFETYYKEVKEVAGKDENEVDFHSYYVLNAQRMDRLQKKITLSDQQKERLSKINRKITFLIITEGWCGDAAQSLPVVQKIVEASDNLDARLVYRDENPDLMDAYLTNGGKSIPIVIGMDSATGEHIFRWGPRPEFGNALLKKFKAEEITKEEFQLELQKAYNKDKGAAIVDELLSKLES